MATPVFSTRPLSPAERSLAAYMLSQASKATPAHQDQLAQAAASTWHCECGCASYNFALPGLEAPKGGVQVIGDFVFGAGATLAGAFIFARDGILAGVEIYGLAGDAPRTLPTPEELRPFTTAP